MSATTRPAAAEQVDPEREEAAQALGRAFKGALAALRRMRGRERQIPGELSDAQYGVLFCLRDAPERSAGEIALAADLSPASATEMLESLEQAGLVERARSSRDRRVVLSSLTNRGRELVEQRWAKHDPLFRAAMARFSSDELRTTAAVLEQLREMFDQLADERSKPGP
jgi:MarR family transcriptional regulator, organic hydroperoxide resistance regulator